MIRISVTLDMPAGHADLAEFSALLDEHDMPPAAFELAGASTPDRLISIKELGTDPLPAATPVQATPAPAPAPRTPPSRPRTQRAAGTGRGSVDVPGKICRTLEERGGRFEGSMSDLARLAHPANPGSGNQTIRKMIKARQLVAERSGRSVVAVSLPGTRAAARQAPAAAEPAPAAPAPDPAELATEPIRRVPFDPDKARAGAVLGL